MHIAQVTNWSEGPRYTTVPDLPPPTFDQLQLRVLAAGLHQVVRSRASGMHYSARELPHNVGVDCVGLHEPTGRLYYAFSLEAGLGTFADFVNVARESAYALPEGANGDNIDPARFAASLNPAMSSWMALTQRTGAPLDAGPGKTGLPPKFTALVLGATSASGRLAARAARELGAARVVGVARDAAALERLTLAGLLDEHVVLRDPVASTDYSSVAAAGPDVILDYVYGEAAVHLLSSLRTRKPVQYVAIGGLSGQREVVVPSALLRSGDITIRGAAPGAWRLSALERELPALVAKVATWELAEAQPVPLKDIAEVWNDKEVARKGRIVFVP
ncbi:hypothetical protein SLS62_009241 [Diatrype stigma]|uniref:Quinone oxidoreductase n=1 Tax=Diatrype stigma TaxID=117547 RepID=A0AAN9UIF6_9PEZI